MRRALLIGCALLLLAFATAAQDDRRDTTAARTDRAEPAELGLEVPRGSVARLLQAMEENDWQDAAELLDLRNLPSGYVPADGPKLAEELSEILARKLWIDIENLSADPGGMANDGLPGYRDLLGEFDDHGETVELYVQRIPDGRGGRIWKVSTASVALIPELHERFGKPPIVEFAERFLPEGRFLHVDYAKWAISLAATLLMLVVGRPLLGGLAHLLTTPTSPYRPRLRKLLRGPVLLLLIVLLSRALFQHMGLGLAAQSISQAGTVLMVMLVWLLFGVVNLVRDVIGERMLRRDQRDATALLRPSASAIKVLIFVVAVVAWLENLGFNVTTLVAGLGVGGIAVALALQRPLEDLIAAVTLYGQQIIRTGGFCHFGSVRGTVEEIGLRNTRLRTLRNTVVSIPNSRVVHESINNFSARRKFL